MAATTYLEDVDQEFGLKLTVKDDWRNPGKYESEVRCAVTGSFLKAAEGIQDLEMAKIRVKELSREFRI